MNNPILLVEDTEDDRIYFNRIFRKSGAAFSLHHASNGVTAIDFLRHAATSKSLPRIIFLDLKMPILNGFDVLEWMQKQTFPYEMKVVVLSGSDQQEDKDRAFQLGAADYLVKPVTVADLGRILREVPCDAKCPVPAQPGEQA